MITEEYFREEYDRLIKILCQITCNHSYFAPIAGKEKLYAEVKFQLDTLQTACAIAYFNELHGREPEDGCGSIGDKKQSFVLRLWRGIK
jgi:hypothetical protein